MTIFIWGGVFWDTFDLDSLTIFILGGVFWDTLDLDSMTIFIWGYSGTPQIWTLWQFSFWGDILGHLGFGLSDNFHLGVFLDTSDLDSMTIFILGGILGHLGFGLSDNFHFGGYSGTPWIWILWQFSFWRGSILGHLGFGLWQFSFWGDILGHLGFGLYDNFHFGGYSGTPLIWTLWQF